MAQDRDSGGEANRYGHETARRLGNLLGAKMDGPGNEATLAGHRCVIKCARARTDSIGVYFTTLGRVAEIIAALEQTDGSYHLHRVTPEWFRAHMRGAAGTGRNKAGMVRRADIVEAGGPFRIVAPGELAST